jgi:hypothetical protein
VLDFLDSEREREREREREGGEGLDVLKKRETRKWILHLFKNGNSRACHVDKHHTWNSCMGWTE